MIKDKLDEEIKKCDKVYYDDKDGNIDVVDVTVVYDNAEMLKLLKKRGTIIGNGEFSKFDEIE